MGEVRLDQVPDSRDRRGRRWRLDTLLTSALFGLVAGCRSLREVEQLTEELARPIREKLGIPRRVPATTLRDALSSLEPDLVRPVLHAATRTARRRKALDPDSLPSESSRSTASRPLSLQPTTSWRQSRSPRREPIGAGARLAWVPSAARMA